MIYLLAVVGAHMRSIPFHISPVD
ncbi:uncharacterized protein METZ01_LOCUS88212 [marine metagenome]|uniref:Uncharacterized protein n=1 Tax=marine metagenome TaxID=408172 RepID=A0A381V6G8_9ZZZZ